MPRFGFVGVKALPHLVEKFKPAQFIGIAPRAYSEAKPLFPDVKYNDWTDRWFNWEYEREQVDFELMSLYDHIKSFGPDDLIIFGCDMGQSRSRVAASVFSILFDRPEMVTTRCHTNPGEEEQVYHWDNVEVEMDVLIKSLVKRYREIIPTSEK